MDGIEFRQVSFGHARQTRVLDGFSLTVEAGETLALVGASGAGKTTVLKLVNRLLVADAGEVRVQGKDTREWDAIRLRRSVGYVIQEVGLFPHLTVAQNIAVVPDLLGWEKTRIPKTGLAPPNAPPNFAGRTFLSGLFALAVPFSTVQASPGLAVALDVQTTIGAPSYGPFTARGIAVDQGVVCPDGWTFDVNLDATGRNELRWFQDIGPLIAGAVGVVLLIAGIMLVWLKRRGQPEQADAEEPEPALDPAL